MKSKVTQRSEVAATGSEVSPCAPSESFTRSDSFRYDDEGLVEHQITFTATNSYAGRCQANNSGSNSGARGAATAPESKCCGRARTSFSNTDVHSNMSPAGNGQPVPKGALLLGSALLIGVAVLLGVACLSRANREHPSASKQ